MNGHRLDVLYSVFLVRIKTTTHWVHYTPSIELNTIDHENSQQSGEIGLIMPILEMTEKKFIELKLLAQSLTVIADAGSEPESLCQSLGFFLLLC